MRWAAAWADSVVGCRALERVWEATGLSDVEALDRVRVAMGYWGGERGGDTLGRWRPLGVGMWYIGSRIGGTGNSEVVLGGAGGGRGAGALGGGGGATLGDRRGGTLGGGGGVGGGGEGSCGFVVLVQFWNKLRSWRMASSWASILAEGVSFRALERNWRACMSQSAWMEVGCAR